MHRLILALLASLAVVACASAPPASTVADVDVAIQNVTVVDVVAGRTVANRDVLLKGDRIVGVVASGRTRPAAAARVLDGRGAFVIPGLWDMHAHLFFPFDPIRQQLPWDPLESTCRHASLSIL